MLIKDAILKKIRTGKVSLAFRKWRKPAIGAGSQFRTAIGVLRADEVAETRDGAITEADARAAGYSGRAELLSELAKRDGKLFRIVLNYVGADPRVSLRRQDRLKPEDVAAISKRLAALDARSSRGAWTINALRKIRMSPRVQAAALGSSLGLEKEWLKLSVRKLKELGLTISHSPGYTLSPRGEAFLRALHG